jgi:hypothetical protein
VPSDDRSTFFSDFVDEATLIPCSTLLRVNLLLSPACLLGIVYPCSWDAHKRLDARVVFPISGECLTMERAGWKKDEVV